MALGRARGGGFVDGCRRRDVTGQHVAVMGREQKGNMTSEEIVGRNKYSHGKEGLEAA